MFLTDPSFVFLQFRDLVRAIRNGMVLSYSGTIVSAILFKLELEHEFSWD